MLTTRRSMVPAHRPASRSYRNRCLRVWMTSPGGRGATDYSSTPVRQRCSGVRQVAGSIRFPTIQSGSVLIGFFPHSVRNLGIYLDSDASMRVHVSKTVSNCFAVIAALRQIRSIRRCVPRQVLVSLVVSLVELCADEMVVGGGVGWSYDRGGGAPRIFHRRRRRGFMVGGGGVGGVRPDERALKQRTRRTDVFLWLYRCQPLHL